MNTSQSEPVRFAPRLWSRMAPVRQENRAGSRLSKLFRKIGGRSGLHDSELKFFSLATNFPGPVWIKDRDGGYQFINRVAEALYDRPGAQWIGKTDADFFSTEAAEQFITNDGHVLRTGQPLLTTEWVPIRATIHYMMVSRFPIRTSVETLLGGIAIDISDGVRAQGESAKLRHQLLAGEASRPIVELSSTLAHDLNNTLNALMLRTSLLAARGLNPEQQTNLAIIGRLIEQAAASVHRLQRFASDRVPFSATTDLALMLSEEVRAFDNAVNVPPDPTTVKTFLNVSPLLPKVMGSESEVRYVVATLLRNAREAMPGGGTVEITAYSDSDRVVLTVADEGTGIGEERLAHIFDPFFSSKNDDLSGLGLSGSFAIMARLGGTISAANRTPRGATFMLSFPAFNDPPGVRITKPQESEQIQSDQASPKHRVLVIDDNLDNLEAMKESLERRGYEVETACDGHQGLELLGNQSHFDSVICDVGMPVLNGWEVAQEIAQIAPATRVYMLTGWANEIPPNDPRRSRVADVIAKPTSVEQIDAALSRKH